MSDLRRRIQQEVDTRRIWFGAHGVYSAEAASVKPISPEGDLRMMSTGPPSFMVVDDQAPAGLRQFR